MNPTEVLAIIQLLEQLIPAAVSIYTKLSAGSDTATKTIDQLIADADSNFNQVIKNSSK